MATRKEVAQLAGVSVATVSYVLNGTKKVTAEVEARVREAVKQLNYRPNLLARGLSKKETRHVVLVADNLNNPHISDLLCGAQEIASKNGYIVSVLSVHVSQPQDLLDLTRRGVDGVILALAKDNRELLDLLDPDMPIAFLGGCLDLIAGHVKRAPLSWQKCGLEWLYRLIQEPQRISRMIKLPQILFLALIARGKERK